MPRSKRDRHSKQPRGKENGCSRDSASHNIIETTLDSSPSAPDLPFPPSLLSAASQGDDDLRARRLVSCCHCHLDNTWISSVSGLAQEAHVSISHGSKGLGLFALDGFNDGELVLQEEATLSLLCQESIENRCYRCYRPDASFPCDCEHVSYCSESCQNDDTERHKALECALFSTRGRHSLLLILRFDVRIDYNEASETEQEYVRLLLYCMKNPSTARAIVAAQCRSSRDEDHKVVTALSGAVRLLKVCRVMLSTSILF